MSRLVGGFSDFLSYFQGAVPSRDLSESCLTTREAGLLAKVPVVLREKIYDIDAKLIEGIVSS